MPRPFLVEKKWLEKLLTKAVKSRYGIDLDVFLADIKAGTAEGKYPNSDDLIGLAKYLA